MSTSISILNGGLTSVVLSPAAFVAPPPPPPQLGFSQAAAAVLSVSATSSSVTGTLPADPATTGDVTINQRVMLLVTRASYDAAPAVSSAWDIANLAEGLAAGATVTFAGVPAGSYVVVWEARDQTGATINHRSGYSPQLNIAVAAGVPAAFGVTDWALTDAGTGGDAIVTVFVEPDTGGSPLTALQARIAGTTIVSLGAPQGADADYAIPHAFTDDAATNTEIRALNVNGAGPWSDIKPVTTTGPTVPAVPSPPGLSVQGVTITATITDPASSTPITRRDLRYGTNGTDWTVLSGVTNPRAIADLVTATTYLVQAQVANAQGDSGWSTSATITTDATPDVTAPVVNSFAVVDTTVSVNITEDSDAATAVWATADRATNPTPSDPPGGWVGTIYESGTYPISAGQSSRQITITDTTPDGDRELSFYWYDAAGNVSDPVRRHDFTKGAPPASGLDVEQEATILNSSGNVNSYETSSVTYGSASNRAGVLAMTIGSQVNAANLSDLRVTFGAAGRTLGTGTAATQIFGPFNVGGRRTQVAFAVFINPTGTGTFQIDGGASMAAACARFVEYSGADQTIGNYGVLTGDGGTTEISFTSSGTAGAGDLLSALAILSGDYTAQIAATGGATLSATANTGTTGFSDITAAWSRETVTAGANGNGFSWTTAADAEMATLNIPAA